MRQTQVMILEREGMWIGIVKVNAIVDLVAAEEDEGAWKEKEVRRGRREDMSKVVAEKIRSNTIMSQ